MMGRLNHDQAQLFYSFHLDEAVPHDHPIRKIAAVLDLSWVRSELAPFYPEMGRPSIDPELMHYRAAALLSASPQLAESIRAAKRFRVVPIPR
jgi:hypothetical protein